MSLSGNGERTGKVGKMKKLLFIVLLISASFLLGAIHAHFSYKPDLTTLDYPKISTRLELSEECIGIGFSEEVFCSGAPKCELEDGQTFNWDGYPGIWTVVQGMRTGKDYQTFLLIFCTDNTNVPEFVFDSIKLEMKEAK